MNTDSEGGRRHLSSSLSIPQWMKTRISDRTLDINDSAFSPPDNDDNFLYIRYPKEITKRLKSPSPNRSISNTVTTKIKVAETTEYISNHTDPCKNYIQEPGYKPYVKAKKSPELKIKSAGTDDGFKGEGAACGTSIIRVAHQMISGKLINHCADVEADPLKPEGFEASARRGSKSLPASPLSSPPNSPMNRRRVINKYFTNPFVDSDNRSSNWILQGLLSKRGISQSVGFIPEESTKEDAEKAASDLHLNEPKYEPKKERKVIKNVGPKPSEFRELNFWSPTSM